jgi:hypothetical protein
VNLKSRVEELESKAGVGREVIDSFMIGVPGPSEDPDGSIVAAGLQRIKHGDLVWTRREKETEKEFMGRAAREAPLASPGAYLRSFTADYRESK